MVEEAYNWNSSQITPSFFSDIKTSEFVSIPINIKYKDDTTADQWSSFIDYNENIFKSGQERQRDMLFKYDDPNLKVVDEETKTNITFLQQRRNTG